MKWLAEKPIAGRPSTRSPKPVVVGQRQPARVAVLAVLLRKDVRHVLLGHRALEAADDRRGEPVGVVLPRAPAVPLERARGRAGGRARPRCAADREPGARAPRRSRRPARPTRAGGSAAGGASQRRARSRVHDLDACRRARQDSSESSSRSSPSSSQRGRTPSCAPGTSRRPSLSVAARQSCSRGPRRATFRPSARELGERPVARSNDARVPPASSTTPSLDGRARAGPRRGAAATAARAAPTRPRGPPVPIRPPRAGRTGT